MTRSSASLKILRSVGELVELPEALGMRRHRRWDFLTESEVRDPEVEHRASPVGAPLRRRQGNRDGTIGVHAGATAAWGIASSARANDLCTTTVREGFMAKARAGSWTRRKIKRK